MITAANETTSAPIIDPQATRDIEQLRLAAIYHYVFAAMSALFSITLVFPLLGAIEHKRFVDSLASDPQFRGFFSDVSEASAWTIVIIAAAMAACWLFAAALAIAGKLLAAHRNRAFCMGTAATCCLAFPLGTMLGAFTLAVLNRQSVQVLFDQPTEPPRSSANADEPTAKAA